MSFQDYSNDSNSETSSKVSSLKATTPSRPAESRRCSLCGKSFDPVASQHLPFCGARCRQIDLGNWLTERYGFPLDGQEEWTDDLDEQ